MHIHADLNALKQFAAGPVMDEKQGGTLRDPYRRDMA